MARTPLGEIVEEELVALPSRCPFVTIRAHIVMPNHTHAFMVLSALGSRDGLAPRSLSAVMAEWKSRVAGRAARELGLVRIWQRSFHDRIVREDDDVELFLDYIRNNPRRWEEDRLRPRE